MRYRCQFHGFHLLLDLVLIRSPSDRNRAMFFLETCEATKLDLVINEVIQLGLAERVVDYDEFDAFPIALDGNLREWRK